MVSWDNDYSDYHRSYNNHGGYPSSRYLPSPYRDDYFASRHTRRDPYSHNYLYPDGTGPINPGPGLSNRRSSQYASHTSIIHAEKTPIANTFLSSSGSRQISRPGRLPAHYGGDCYGLPRLHGSHSYDNEGMGMGYGRRGLGGGRRYGGYGGGYDSVYE